MTAKLLVREVGQREFVQHNGHYEDDPGFANPAALSGLDKAIAEGERLCSAGNVEAFEVWTRVAAKQRVYRVEDIPQETQP